MVQQAMSARNEADLHPRRQKAELEKLMLGKGGLRPRVE